jgi:hypothetical protein
MSDAWTRMLKWHLNVTKLQKNEFWIKRYFIPETVPVALSKRKKKVVLKSLSLNKLYEKIGDADHCL